MTKANDTYQNSKVTLPQGADTLSIDSDGYLDFYGTSVAGSVLKKFLYTNHIKYSVQTSATGGGAAQLSTVNLRVGVNFIAPSVGGSNMSAWLPSCTIGDEITVMLGHGPLLESVLSLYISTSGCSILGQVFRNASGVSLHTSNLSTGWIKFKCFVDGEWAIVARAGRQVIEH
jgi:hypothetical protein